MFDTFFGNKTLFKNNNFVPICTEKLKLVEKMFHSEIARKIH